jgi:hypothetical protein
MATADEVRHLRARRPDVVVANMDGADPELGYLLGVRLRTPQKANHRISNRFFEWAMRFAVTHIPLSSMTALVDRIG